MSRQRFTGSREMDLEWIPKQTSMLQGSLGIRPMPKTDTPLATVVTRGKRVLEFLILILYPEKPTQVTITVANTIFGALEDRFVHWRQVIASMVGKLAITWERANRAPSILTCSTYITRGRS